MYTISLPLALEPSKFRDKLFSMEMLICHRIFHTKEIPNNVKHKINFFKQVVFMIYYMTFTLDDTFTFCEKKVLRIDGMIVNHCSVY